MLSIKETIRPSADLRNHYNEVSRQCNRVFERRSLYRKRTKLSCAKATGIQSSHTKEGYDFFKIDEVEKIITVYAVTDQRSDYVNIIRGL